jgi:hypothetical protein
MKAYLVINQPKNNIELPFKEQYRVFLDANMALDHAVSSGMEDQFGLGVSKKIGVKTVYIAGDVNISILPVEIESHI